MAFPHFFVVGAPKAGTTALWAALASHPQLFLPSVKEPGHFLAEDGRGAVGTGPGDAVRARRQVWDRRRYEALYATAPAGARRGDASTLHLADPAAHRRIERAVPDARIVAVLRDPVERAYSHWAHLRSDGLEPIADLVEACEAEPGRVRAGYGPHWRYRGLGRYGEQLEQLFAVFDRSQVHLVRYRDLVERPVSTLDGVCTFLGVEPGIVGPLTAENVRPLVPDTARTRRWSAVVRAAATLAPSLASGAAYAARRPLLAGLRQGAAPRPPLDPAARREVLAPLLDDIAVVERLTGWDLGEWRLDGRASSFTTRTVGYSSRPSASPL
jgi:hypothetical protein